MGMAMLIKALGLPEGSTLEDVAEALKIGSDASVADVVAAIVAALDAMADAEETAASDSEETAASDSEETAASDSEEEKASDSEDEEEETAASDSDGEKMEASAVLRLVKREIEKGERVALLSAAQGMGVKPAELALLASASIKSVRAFVNARKASTSKVRAPIDSTRTIKLNATGDDVREFARAMRSTPEAIRKQFGG